MQPTHSSLYYKKLGTILAGSLGEGLVMRLEATCSLEEIKTGKFVSVVGQHYRFFSLITDLELNVSHPDILLFPPSDQEKLLSNVLRQRDTYAKIILRPLLMLDKQKRKMP